MPKHLFAYGTLQHPDIISYVIKRIPKALSANLKDYARYRIKDENFPGIFPNKNAETDGTLFLEITDQEWEKLDEYESDLYERRTIDVLTSHGDIVPAEAYVIPPENMHFLSKDLWDLATFRP